MRKVLNQGGERRQDLQNPNKLRIIAGTAKGKNLRPMMSKVREALFSSLVFMGLFDSNTTSILDVFSGSGQSK